MRNSMLMGLFLYVAICSCIDEDSTSFNLDEQKKETWIKEFKKRVSLVDHQSLPADTLNEFLNPIITKLLMSSEYFEGLALLREALERGADANYFQHTFSPLVELFFLYNDQKTRNFFKREMLAAPIELLLCHGADPDLYFTPAPLSIIDFLRFFNLDEEADFMRERRDEYLEKKGNKYP